MKELRWDREKDLWLRETRGIGFVELTQAPLIEFGQNLAHPHQSVLFYEYEDYVWMVPCIEEENYLFLKTAYPSRKYTRRWRRGEI